MIDSNSWNRFKFGISKNVIPWPVGQSQNDNHLDKKWYIRHGSPVADCQTKCDIEDGRFRGYFVTTW